MGMFDYLRCKYPLPVPEAQDVEFQTKDLHCQMDNCEIREDGTLWTQDYDFEDRSDPNATGLLALCGSMTRVNIRPIQMDKTGEVRFYSHPHEFSAYFENGRLVRLNDVSEPN